MGQDMHARNPHGGLLSPQALRDFTAASDAVIEDVGFVWGCLNEGSLRGRDPCGAVSDLMDVRLDEDDVWSAAEVKKGAIRAQEEYRAMKDRGEFEDDDKFAAYASALAFIVTAAEHGLEIWHSY